MADDAIVTIPEPFLPSTRYVGVELEYDAPGDAKYHAPQLPGGWAEKPDNSLTNGKEFVMEPPLPLNEAKAAIEEFCAAATKAKMHLSKRGSCHVHVRCQDFSLEQATNLVRLYSHYQKCIDKLVAPSRRAKSGEGHNRFCAPFDEHRLTREGARAYVTSLFDLDQPARTRQDAKISRRQMVVNLAMYRTIEPMQRTFEFRQQSPSKKAVNIYGWVCFVTGLTELALHLPTAIRYITAQATWKRFIAMCRAIESLTGGSGLAAWAQWRHDYLNQEPTDKQIGRLCHALSSRPHGLCYAARAMNVHMGFAARLVEAALKQQLITEVTVGKFKLSVERQAVTDLNTILEAWRARPEPVVTEAAPAVVAVPVVREPTVVTELFQVPSPVPVDGLIVSATIDGMPVMPEQVLLNRVRTLAP